MTKTEQSGNRLSMEVDPIAINSIIRETINAQIGIALQKQGVDFAGAVVEAVLDARVDREGKIIPRGHYNYKNGQSWFDYEIKNLLRGCAKDAMQHFVEQQQPKIEKAMLSAFNKRTPQIVKAMTDGTIKAFTSRWGFSFDVKLSPQDQH